MAATAIVVTLQIAAVSHPFFRELLHTTALSLGDWVAIVIVASLILWVEEMRKWYMRRTQNML